MINRLEDSVDRVINMRLKWIIPLVGAMSSGFVMADELVVGDTYPISEPDLLVEIQEKSKRANWQELFNTDPDSWSGLSGIRELPSVVYEQTRYHTPIYTLDKDIRDHEGQIIYPKGYTFNPLEYISLPSRLIIIGESEDYIGWLKNNAEPFDMVLTAGGNPMKLSEKYGKPVFLLEESLRYRLDVRVIPSVIEQTGTTLKIDEYVLNQPEYLSESQG